jgi:hypothetical protein
MNVAALLCLPFFLVTAYAAQTTGTGSIGGVVRDAGTGAPVAEAGVNLRLPNGRTVSSRVDAQGRYTLDDIPPGAYRLEAFAPLEDGQTLTPHEEKTVTLEPGQLTAIDFRLPSMGVITGRVLDTDNEPVSAVVVLVEKRYDHGALRYRLAGGRTQTDDAGVYRLTGVPTGEVFLVETQAFPANTPGDSPASTFYLNAVSTESAGEIVLSPGETRNGVDIHRAKLPAYCVDGVVEDAAASARSVEVFDTLVGNSSHGVQHNPAGLAKIKPDGTFHVCGLHRGQYVVLAAGRAGTLEVPNGDVSGFKLRASISPVSAEFVWDGDPPAQGAHVSGAIALQGLRGNAAAGFGFAVPGSLPQPMKLQPDDYTIEVRGVSSGWYVKDAICGGRSVLRGTASLGGDTPCGDLRFIIAHDAASLTARVADNDDNPISDAYVAIIPESAATEGEMSALMTVGQTGPNGVYSASNLPPGKYRVVATNDTIDLAANRVDKLWAAQAHAQEVEIGANANVQLRLEPQVLQ